MFSLLTLILAASAYAKLAGIAPVRPSSPPKVKAPLSNSKDISYKMGGTVLTDPINVYVIYYGVWEDRAKSLIETFIKNIGASSWGSVMKEYYYQADANSTRRYVSGEIKLAGTFSDYYSQGYQLSGKATQKIVQTAFENLKMPKEKESIYLVLTDPDVSESRDHDIGTATMCTDYCGYHSNSKLEGYEFYYAMVGNPQQCLGSCADYYNLRTSPNGMPAIDAMLSVIAHELVESISDPDLFKNKEAWATPYLQENGDVCGWKFGETYRLEDNEAIANMNIAGVDYLIQQNWSPAKGECVTGAE